MVSEIFIGEFCTLLNSYTVVYPFATSSWFRLWLAHLGKNLDLHFLRVSTEKGEVLGAFERAGEEVHFAGGEEIADYLDLIGPEWAKAAAWAEIGDYFKHKGVAKLVLRNFPDDSGSMTFFRETEKLPSLARGPLVEIVEEDTTPILTLPADWEIYVSSLDRKDRHELRRKMRKFEAEHVDVHFELSTQPEKDMRTLLSLMKLEAPKADFLTSEMETFFLALPKAFPETIKIMQLKHGVDIIASVVAFVQNGTLYLYNSGFNEAAFTGSGFYLKAKSVQWAIEQKLTNYNFLQGHERYKYELGGKDVPVWRVSLNFQ